MGNPETTNWLLLIIIALQVLDFLYGLRRSIWTYANSKIKPANGRHTVAYREEADDGFEPLYPRTMPVPASAEPSVSTDVTYRRSAPGWGGQVPAWQVAEPLQRFPQPGPDIAPPQTGGASEDTLVFANPSALAGGPQPAEPTHARSDSSDASTPQGGLDG